MRTTWAGRLLMLSLGIFSGVAHQIAPRVGWSEAATTSNDEVEIVAVPAGDFIMGSNDPDADENEKPASKVFVGAFSIDKFEVTSARYLRCIEAGVCTRPVGRGIYMDFIDGTTKANLPASVIS